MPRRPPAKEPEKPGTARPRPRTKRRDADVLEAALKVFYERGYSAATVQDVADELEILKGSVYHYIDTKEDLLFRLIEEVHLRVEEILEVVKGEADLDPIRQLELYVRWQVEYNIENLEKISVYYHDLGRLTGDRLKWVKASRRIHEDFVAGLIEEAQKQGLAEDSASPRLLANCVFGTIIWTYQWFNPARMSRKPVVDVCVRHALHGVTG